MDPKDRKRVFSNAFDVSDDPYPKVLRTMACSCASPEPSSSPPVFFDSSKENRDPSEMITHTDFQSRGGSPLGSLFCSNPNVSFSGDDMLGHYSPAGPAICEDPATSSSTPSDKGEVGPAVRCLQELSLHDEKKAPLPKVHQSCMTAARTSVFKVESHSLRRWFPHVDPSDVIVCFDKGKQVTKTKNYILSQVSPFFAKMLNDPYLDGNTRCIRLRNDFAHAVIAMMQFVEHGIYVLTTTLCMQYPYMTLLDLHVHAYVIGAKYAVSGLCRHAMDEYINMSSMILSLRANGFDQQHLSVIVSDTDSFLDSLVLIWRNTKHREDALRQAVLELLKPVLHQLLHIPFFQTLLFELTDFGDDVLNSLEEDGFDIRVYLVDPGLQENVGVSFKSV